MEKIGLVSYRITLQEYFGDVHDVFHVSFLRKSFGQWEPWLIDPSNIQLHPSLKYKEAPTLDFRSEGT